MTDPTSDLDQKSEQGLAGYERIVRSAELLTKDEKAALAAWEKEFVTGDGKFSTSDWPGWPAVFQRTSH